MAELETNLYGIRIVTEEIQDGTFRTTIYGGLWHRDETISHTYAEAEASHAAATGKADGPLTAHGG